MDVVVEEEEAASDISREARRKVSYKDIAMGITENSQSEKVDEGDDKEISDDDLIEEATDDTSFKMGMTCEEKLEARLPWRNSLIVKLAGRSIGYHYLWRRLQASYVEDSSGTFANQPRKRVLHHKVG